ncbi:MAG: hypothetical protein IJT36_01670 [Alphaproteobacteria bacterium]|nr:hypothetical protein [Alphaproteobacteria bacterium]
MKLRKHDAMYKQYGIHKTEKCRDCCNFALYQMSNKRVSKCAAYGVTHSEATDWNGRKLACGLFNVPFPDDMPFIEILKHQKKVVKETNCEGQISLI